MLDIARGTRGHPSHPPMTDVAIGCYTFAAASLVIAALGYEESILAGAGFFALLLGLAATVAAAVTGLLDWLVISPGTELKRTATYHGIVMVVGTVLFVLS